MCKLLAAAAAIIFLAHSVAAEPPQPSPLAQLGFALLEAGARCTRLKEELAVSRGAPDENQIAAQMQRWCNYKLELIEKMKSTQTSR
jgi:hypothetical protein